MSYNEVKERIRDFLKRYKSRISVEVVAEEVNTTNNVARKALEMLCEDSILIRDKREYRIK